MMSNKFLDDFVEFDTKHIDGIDRNLEFDIEELYYGIIKKEKL